MWETITGRPDIDSHQPPLTYLTPADIHAPCIFSYLASSCHVLSNLVLSCSFKSRLVMFCQISSCHVLSNLVLSCSVKSRLVLFFQISSCHVLFNVIFWIISVATQVPSAAWCQVECQKLTNTPIAAVANARIWHLHTRADDDNDGKLKVWWGWVGGGSVAMMDIQYIAVAQ